MSNGNEARLGETTTMYCSRCEKETTWGWVKWGERGTFGMGAYNVYGWKCTRCGIKQEVTSERVRN